MNYGPASSNVTSVDRSGLLLSRSRRRRNNAQARRSASFVKKWLRSFSKVGRSQQLSLAYAQERRNRLTWIVKNGQENSRIVPNRAQRRGAKR